MKLNKNIIVLGGGAAGYFGALNIGEKAPDAAITIIEKTSEVLSKVRVSGGGRCNVTNITTDPRSLVRNYPRGEKELLGPFTRFSSSDTVRWFEEKGIKLKTEEDGRIFPISDNSETIVSLFIKEAEKRRINLIRKTSISGINMENGKWVLNSGEQKFYADYLIAATGSNLKIWELLKKLGHNIVPPVPSLFTFNIQDIRIQGLAGVSVKNTECSAEGFGYLSSGPLLITHWGLSGPAVLKLSSFAARFLNETKYKFKLKVNWAANTGQDEIRRIIENKRDTHDSKTVFLNNLCEIPARLWSRLIEKSGIEKNRKWAELSNKLIDKLVNELTNSEFMVSGKSTFKEEFVTAGGVELKEVNFKTMESRLHKNLFFAGEILDIDAITGGFNFQSAWTTGWIAANEIAERIKKQ